MVGKLVGWWVGVAVCVTAATGCRALTRPDALEPGPRGSAPPPSAPAPQGGQVCPPALPSDVGLTPQDGWSAPSTAPFSCDPLPDAFFFAPPGADVPGAYARCASFADARASAVAVSPDGTRVALVGIDGIARIVDVATHLVLGTLAPARQSVNLVAFSPTGDRIVTVARGERTATLWRADTFAAVWTTALPGQPYFRQYPGTGAAAFAPDGTTTLVSPGGDLFLLDAATGAIRATRATPGAALLQAGFAWGGQRIAVAEAPITGDCTYAPTGGSVTVVDPATLASLTTVMTWDDGPFGPDRGADAHMLVAADADLVLTTGSAADPGLHAFRASDGARLAAPPFATWPVLLTPDGGSALLKSAALLQLAQVSDGTVTASTAAPPWTAAAVSADGAAFAVGGSGAGLLGVWRPAEGALAPTCSATAGDGTTDVATALSADGSTVAVDWGTEVHVLRRSDGALISTISDDGHDVSDFALSPDGAELIGQLTAKAPAGSWSLGLFRTSDGTRIANVPNFIWSPKIFSSDGRQFEGVASDPATGDTITGIDLLTGTATKGASLTGDEWLVGFSADCPLLASLSRGVWRSCPDCNSRPFASARTGLLSLDGGFYLAPDAGTDPIGTTLWRVLPTPARVRSYPPRSVQPWAVDEAPVAISKHGERVITAAASFQSCGAMPGFTSRVHDVATDQLVDELPPGITGASADLDVLAYGPVLWCAR